MTDFIKVSDDTTKLHIENVVADTTEGEITITMPEDTGRYTINIIPIEDEK